MAYLSQKIWVPKTKRELVNALVKMYPDQRSKFNQKKKKQLYAIYFSKRKVKQIDLGGY